MVALYTFPAEGSRENCKFKFLENFEFKHVAAKIINFDFWKI